VSVGAVFQTAGDPWVHTVIAKNADRHAEQFESDAYDEVLTVPFADPFSDRHSGPAAAPRNSAGRTSQGYPTRPGPARGEHLQAGQGFEWSSGRPICSPASPSRIRVDLRRDDRLAN